MEIMDVLLGYHVADSDGGVIYAVIGKKVIGFANVLRANQLLLEAAMQ